jgi:acetyl esterase/lipase
MLEVTVNEMQWEKLTDIYGRMEADVLKSYLEAEGIPVELFQEAVGHHAFPTTVNGLARVQFFVPREKAAQARKALEQFMMDSATPKEKRKNK